MKYSGENLARQLLHVLQQLPKPLPVIMDTRVIRNFRIVQMPGQRCGAFLVSNDTAPLPAENPEITTKQIGDKLGFSSRAIRKQITIIRAAKQFLRIGVCQLGRWEVLK